MKTITLYGAKRCHKTQHYMRFFENENLKYTFLDIESNKANAEKLRNLYNNGKLNFPTITIDKKRLRNPSDKELTKWLNK